MSRGAAGGAPPPTSLPTVVELLRPEERREGAEERFELCVWRRDLRSKSEGSDEEEESGPEVDDLRRFFRGEDAEGGGSLVLEVALVEALVGLASCFVGGRRFSSSWNSMS